MMLHRVTTPVLLAAGLLCLAATGPTVIAQSETGQRSVQKGIPARTIGIQGQRARLPVPGNSGRTPIQRQTTLPGLSTNTSSVGGGAGGQPGIVVRPGGYVHHGSGVRLDGSYDDGGLSLRFHLGNGARLLRDGTLYYPAGRYSTGVYTEGTYLHTGRYGSGYHYNPYWYYDSGRYWSTQPIDGVMTRQLDPTLLMRPQPQQVMQPAEPPRELTPLELARVYFAADEAEKAIEAFRDHLAEDPEDVDAMRSLGLAMLDAGRLSDGTAMVALAYRTDALLARSPVDLDELGLGARRHDRLLSRALTYAKRTDASSAHLAGVVLLQAEGKTAGAIRVLERAERAGLEEDITDAFRRELGTPVHR
jgi:hypothetical protein